MKTIRPFLSSLAAAAFVFRSSGRGNTSFPPPAGAASSAASTSSWRGIAAAAAAAISMSTSATLQQIDDASAYNRYASAAVDLSNAHVSESGLLTVVRSVRDIDNAKRRSYLYTIPLLSSASAATKDGNVLSPLFQIPPSELPEDVLLRLPSPSGQKVALFRSSKKSSKNGNSDSDNNVQQSLEIWVDGGQTLQRRIDLSTPTIGKVIVDAANFGRPSWHPDETVLVVTVEHPAIKTSSYFETKKTEDDSSNKPKAIVGGQNVLGLGKTERWGEKYSLQNPLHDLLLVNVVTGRMARVENVPGGADTTATTTSGSYSLGQPIFDGTGKSIVFTGWDAGGHGQMPRRLGLIYCTQRPCQLYRSDVSELLQTLALEKDEAATSKKAAESETKEKEAGFTPLTPSHRLSHSPRLSPDGNKLVFYTSKKGFEMHNGCFALGVLEGPLDGDKIREPCILVDAVWDPAKSPNEAGKVAGLGFTGLYGNPPYSCFPSDNCFLTTTQWGSCQKVVCISLKGGVRLIQNCSLGDALSSDELLCISPNGDAIVAVKTPNKPGSVHLIPSSELHQVDAPSNKLMESKLLAEMAPISATKLSAVSSSSLLVSDFSFDVRVIDAPTVPGVEFQGPLQSILLLPHKTNHSERPPLIVVPHGGPHGASSTMFLPSYSYLCGHGRYAILLVNYRGSTGQGQGSIKALPTNIGSLDVQDVVAATLEVSNSGLVDEQRIGICGGSHGGFLAAHATSQYPELFRAAVMRNPVVNLASMATSTDIPDWCYVEAMGSYHWNEYRPPTKEDFDSFYSKSPIQYIQKVQTPTLVALGLKDLRVPPSQGLEWFHTLRSMGIDTKLLTYENDDHAIDDVVSEADHWINIKQWFDKYLKC